MATKGTRKLQSLLGDDKKHAARNGPNRSSPVTRSSAADNIFSMLAEEVKQDGADSESPDVSEADPTDILKNMKDMDDMDADLFAPKKKPSSAPAQTKSSGKGGPTKSAAILENNEKAVGVGVKPSGNQKKPNSAPSLGQHYKTFNFSDLDDQLDDLLPEETRQNAKDKSVPSSPASPVLKNKAQATTKKLLDLTFDDNKDDVIDALGFDSDQNSTKKKNAQLWSKQRSDPPQRTRTKVDEIVESLTSPHLLDRPPTGEKKEQPQEKNTVLKDKQDDDLTFGSYQPSVVSMPEGRQSRRQSVRFSTEDMSALEKKAKPSTPTRQRGSADWLGLKTNDDELLHDAAEIKTEMASSNPPEGPPLERRASVSVHSTAPAADPPSPADNDLVKVAAAEVSVSQKQNEEDDWLSGALSRKRALSASRPEAATQMSTREETLGPTERADLDPNINKPVSSQAPERIREDAVPAVRQISGTSRSDSGPAAHSTPIREPTMKRDKTTKDLQSTPTPLQQPQITLLADSLQMLLQQQVTQPPLLGLSGHAPAGAQQLVDHQSLQSRIVQLEGQMKTLQLERDQSQLLLENIQLRHKQDVELMENAHKARVKLLEESAAQRETRLRQECEDLMERLDALTRSTQQERSELQAQYQRKLAQAQQERDREVERLRDLQRKSISEMKKDHEDQIRRLKQLKEDEIDAVTSATSQTRSLSGVIEQMEQFSSRLGELSSRVESTHESAAHGLEQGARHRDEQLRIMQDRLAQQQKAMAEEKAYLKEIISRMDTQISEQKRALEKERWKATSEQAKAESTQRSLEEERRSLSMQMNMEREELERAKSALLEEQKSVMQHCAEERRKLAAEWAGFHAQEKQRHDRAEREVSSLLERREGSIISMAQEQADLKLRTAELKQKEIATAQERENLDRLREELDREKERISTTALRLKTRAQEVEAFSKLAADKFEEGERTLHQAKLVEAEHEARLRQIHSQTEKLRQQEQRILQERMQVNNLQKEQPRALPSFPQVLTPVPPDLTRLVPSPKLATKMSTLPNTSANPESMALHASLALWKYAAERDREYLEDEKIFLENLKKKSHNSNLID